MAPAVRPKGSATFADLNALPPDRAAEIVHGTIVDKAAPTMEHAVAQVALSGFLHRRFQRGGGARWPGGWWIGSEVDVEYAPHELFRHDLAGWRRDRTPQRPTGRPVRVTPDWVAEILSPSNEARDLVDKLRVLRDVGVPHYWILHPMEKVLLVHRLEAAGDLLVLSAREGETVRAEPFDAVELQIGQLFGDDDDE